MIWFLKILGGLVRFEGSPGRRILAAVVAAIALNVIFGTAFYFAEREVQEGLSFTDSIWWAMVTMTTVGYGDYFPQTPIGRFLIAYPCFLLGIGLIGILLGTVSEGIIEYFSRKRKGLTQLIMQNHVIIAGCPSIDRVEKIFSELRLSMSEEIPFVVVSNQFDELPPRLRDLGISFVKGSLRDQDVVTRSAVKNATGVIILDDQDGANDSEIYTTASYLKNLFPEKVDRLLAMIENPGSEALFSKAGLRYISSDGIPDRIMTQDLNQPGIGQVFTQLLSYRSGCELYLRPQKLIGQALAKIQKQALDSPDRIQVVGVRGKNHSDLNPPSDYQLQEGDSLILIARNSTECDAFVAHLHE